MLVHYVLKIGIGRVRDVKDMQPGTMFFGQIEGVKKSDVGVLRKIGTKQHVFVSYHGDLLFAVINLSVSESLYSRAYWLSLRSVLSRVTLATRDRAFVVVPVTVCAQVVICLHQRCGGVLRFDTMTL
jgi:hypothetical protein